MTHPAPELEIVTDQQMRNPSVSSLDKPQVMEREWGFRARVDPTVTYEEFVYWAKIEREMELEENKQFHAEHGKSPLANAIKSRLTKEGRERVRAEKEERLQALQTLSEKTPAGAVTHGGETDRRGSLKVSDAEWRNAARALRTASWGQMFFLITTDILGWSGAPYATAKTFDVTNTDSLR